MPTRKPVKRCSDSFWAWLAGFTDGDGSIVFDVRRRRYPTLSYTQKDQTPLLYIQSRVGCGSLFLGGKRRAYWFLRFGTHATRAMCKKMQRHLVCPDKKARAKEAVAWRPATKRVHDFTKKPHYLEILNAYMAGESALMLSARFGIPQNTIYMWVKHARINRSRSEAQRLRRSRPPAQSSS